MIGNSYVLRRAMLVAAVALVVAGIAMGTPVDALSAEGGFGWGMGLPTL